MYQQLMLIGNLGNRPELRYTPTGVPVSSFSLAVNRSWTGADGTKQEKSTWFRITTWRKQAEIVAEYLDKGAKVMILGEIEEAKPYTDRDGNQRASLEVTATTVKFLSGRGEGTSATDTGGKNAKAAPEEEFDESNVPF